MVRKNTKILLLIAIILLGGYSFFLIYQFFNPSEAIFYNPITNENDILYLNSTEFRNGSAYRILVGLKARNGQPSDNISLNLLVYLETYKANRSFLLINASSNLFVTNASGIAEYLFTYNQTFFKLNGLLGSYGFGYFQVFSPLIENSDAFSPLCSFTYQLINITRSSNSTSGLAVIDHCENLDRLDIAGITLDRNYWYLPIINNTSLTDLAMIPKCSFGIVYIHTAFAFSLSNVNISEQSLDTLWTTAIGLPLYSSNKLYTSSNFSDTNFSQGWLITQYFNREYYCGPLFAEGVEIQQMVLLDQDLNFLWLKFGSSYWES